MFTRSKFLCVEGPLQNQDGVIRYTESLPRERGFMLSRYYVADVAHRIVGVGSVGTRAYLVLLFGNGDDDLVRLVAATVVPLLPLLLTIMPFDRLIGPIFEMLF
jgi:hypothetical protein